MPFARLIAALAILWASIGWTQTGANPILILVSFDGWRWDYTDRLPAPNLRALAARGIRVRELIPSTPTLTFPNHYTIVTGLYPAHHGIVANVMRDPVLPEKFTMSADTARDGRWWGGEPIWVTAERQGLRTGTVFWPGSEAPNHGIRPSRWWPFESDLPASERTARILTWLALPESERPSLMTLYFDDTDHAGHDFGPDSPELRDAVARVDHELGVIVDGIRRRGLEDRTTVVVVSDHGMAQLSPDRVIFLDDYIDMTSVEMLEWFGFASLAPVDDSAAGVRAVYDRLRRAHPHLHVYTRETFPGRFRYRDNPRIAPIIGLADAGWTVTTRTARQKRSDEGRKFQAGAHGFDAADPVMHALFMAAGPGVRQGLVVPSIENVHIYNFLCAVLGIRPAPNDGDPARVSAWIRHSP